MSFEIHENVCEICGQKSSAGILDNYDNNDSNNQIEYDTHAMITIYKFIQRSKKKDLRNEF